MQANYRAELQSVWSVGRGAERIPTVTLHPAKSIAFD